MANKSGRNKKYTYEEVKEHIESIGYKLLSSEYKNSQSKLHMICDKNHDIYVAKLVNNELITINDAKELERVDKIVKRLIPNNI